MKVLVYLFGVPAALIFFTVAGTALGLICWFYLVVQVLAEFKKGWSESHA